MADLYSLFAKAVKFAEESLIAVGHIGRIEANNDVTVNVPGKTHYVFVRTGSGGTTGTVEAFNWHAPRKENTPVQMVKLGGIWVITGVDHQSVNLRTTDYNVAYHTHLIGSGLEYIGSESTLDSGARVNHTIVNGAIEATATNIRLLPETGTIDDLDIIEGGQEGQIIVLGVRNPTDAITVRDLTASGGNIELHNSEYMLDHINASLVLQHVGGNWHLFGIPRIEELRNVQADGALEGHILRINGSGNWVNVDPSTDVTPADHAVEHLTGGGDPLLTLFDSDDITEGITNLFFSAAEETKLAGVEAGADVTGAAITALAAKATPVDADAVVITDSAAGGAPKRTTWANIKATLKTYLDTLYVALTGDQSVAGLKNFTTGIRAAQIGIGTDPVSGVELLVSSSTENANVRADADGFQAAFTARSRRDAQFQSIFTGIGGRGTFASPAASINTDIPLQIVAYCDPDGSGSAINIASVNFEVADTPATGSSPGRIVFATVPSGSVTRVDGLIVTHEQNLNALSTTPGSNARAFFRHATLGSPVLRLRTIATNDDPNEDVIQGRIATANATATTLQTIPIAATTTLMVEAAVTARRTAGAAGTAEDGAGYILRGVFKNVAGVATVIGTVGQTIVGEDQAGWDATLDVDGADNIRVRVTGAVNNSIIWHCTTRIWYHST